MWQRTWTHGEHSASVCMPAQLWNYPAEVLDKVGQKSDTSRAEWYLVAMRTEVTQRVPVPGAEPLQAVCVSLVEHCMQLR